MSLPPVTSSPILWGPIFLQVHKVFPLGAAAQEGSIRAGDQVLSINGTTLCGSGHWEATRTLRKAKSRGMGVVVLRGRGVLTPPEEGDGMDQLSGAQTQSRDTSKGHWHQTISEVIHLSDNR